MNSSLRLTRQIADQLRAPFLFLALALLVFGTGCRTVAPFATVDFTQEGWKIKSGQAIWKLNRKDPDIAGEVLFASHPDGRTVIQMTKNPFPMVIAQLRGNAWQIEFPAHDKTFSGRGTPPKRLSWLHLAKALEGEPVPAPWTFQRTDDTNWKLENLKSGEVIEGFLQ